MKFTTFLENFSLDKNGLFENKGTKVDNVVLDGINIKRYTNEFWTSKQRQANSIHEISYRACYKPQLPKFFIDKFSVKGDIIYDPFLGRGTTIIEAAINQRNVIGNDINPLSNILCEPRINIPAILQKIIKPKSIRASLGHKCHERGRNSDQNDLETLL